MIESQIPRLAEYRALRLVEVMVADLALRGIELREEVELALMQQARETSILTAVLCAAHALRSPEGEDLARGCLTLGAGYLRDRPKLLERLRSGLNSGSFASLDDMETVRTMIAVADEENTGETEPGEDG